MALDLLHQGARIELAEHDVTAADHRQEMGRAPAVHVEQGHHVEDDIGFGEAEPELGDQAVKVELAMGHRDALGQPGRAARVEQLGQVVLVDLGMEWLGRAARQQPFVLVAGDPAGLAVEDDEGRPGSQARSDLLYERQEVAMEGDHLRAGVIEDPGDLVRRETNVDRVEDGAGLEHAVVGLEQVMGVIGDERDPFAVPDSEALQGVGEAVSALAELGVGELPVAVDQPDLVTEERRCPVAKIEDRQRDEHRRPSS